MIVSWFITYLWDEINLLTRRKINMEPENDGFGSDNFPFPIGAQTRRFSTFVRFQNVGLGVVCYNLPAAQDILTTHRELGVRPINRAFLKKEEMVGSRNLKVPIFPCCFFTATTNWSNLHKFLQVNWKDGIIIGSFETAISRWFFFVARFFLVEEELRFFLGNLIKQK